MYSIPVYALRFAAHCRSRMRFTEISQADATRVTVDTAKAWIRFARSHERHRDDRVPLCSSRGRS